MSRKADFALAAVEEPESTSELTVGQIDEIQSDGSVFVTVAGTATRGRARVVSGLTDYSEDAEELVGRDVLVHVGGKDLDDLIVVGLVQDKLSMDEDSPSPDQLSGKTKTVKVDGKKIVIDGDSEVQLTCGKSSILLRRDGRIIIRGDNVTTRAARRNRIKGASVNIN